MFSRGGLLLSLGLEQVIADASSGLLMAGEISLVLFASVSVLLYVHQEQMARGLTGLGNTQGVETLG